MKSISAIPHRSPITNTPRTMFPQFSFSFCLQCVIAFGALLILQSCSPTVFSNHPLARKIRAGTVVRMGDSINTTSLEYGPIAMPDGKRLYYISSRPGSTVQERSTESKPVSSHDFWYVNVLNDSATVFSRPINADTLHAYGSKSLNTPQNEGVGSFCQATQELYFTGCNRPGGYGDCDIYAVKIKVNGEWGEVRNLGVTVNSGNWESQPAISPDGLTLIFTSNRTRTDIKELLGNRDLPIRLWCATRKSISDEWGVPFFVAELNPGEKNWSPFICPDGKTLLFSTNASGGLGGLDFWISERQSDGKWSKPENVGAPLNTDEDDFFLSMPATDNVMYFSSKRRDSYYSVRSDDIYILRLPAVAPEIPTAPTK